MDKNNFKSILGTIKPLFEKIKDFDEEQIDAFKNALKEQILSNLLNESELIKITSNSIGIKKTHHFSVEKIEKYDVILCNVGPCPHFGVVYKVVGDIVYVIVISTKNTFNGVEIKQSKMFKGSYFIPYIAPVHINTALSHFCFVIDNKLEFNNMLKAMKKNYLKSLL